jgi:hypothetical protein
MDMGRELFRPRSHAHYDRLHPRLGKAIRASVPVSPYTFHTRPHLSGNKTHQTRRLHRNPRHLTQPRHLLHHMVHGARRRRKEGRSKSPNERRVLDFQPQERRLRRRPGVRIQAPYWPMAQEQETARRRVVAAERDARWDRGAEFAAVYVLCRVESG